MMGDSTMFPAIEDQPQKEKSLWWRRFFIRLRSWEYWPMYIFNIPVIFTWLWNATRSGDLFFFTRTNPGIDTGGFFGESKSEIMQQIPDQYKPKTILWEAPIAEEEIDELFQQSGLQFPIILKPEVGERGWLIKVIYSMAELKSAINVNPISFILQPFLEWPMEVSIMTYRLPDGSASGITSICQKEFLHVIGDGKSTLRELILKEDRAVLQFDKLKEKFKSRWYSIIPGGENLLLESIGNHCRGTKFLNHNQEIDKEITNVMTGILKNMKGIYYGRFDMKIDSWAGLRSGTGIQILEFNGTSSDPAHIYHPGYSLIRAYRDIMFHWGIMAKIARQNKRAGIPGVGIKKMISALILYFRYKRTN